MTQTEMAIEYEALICEFQVLCTEVKGMEAENLQRQYLGQAMAYTEDSFRIMAEKMKVYAERIRNIDKSHRPR